MSSKSYLIINTIICVIAILISALCLYFKVRSIAFAVLVALLTIIAILTHIAFKKALRKEANNGTN